MILTDPWRILVFAQFLFLSPSDECQISQHKNHRYLFIDEAISNQKSHLQSLVTKVRDVRLMLNKIQQSRTQQRTEIDQIERQVIDDIKLFGINLIAEISRTCKLLIDETNSVCNQARTQFNERNTRFEQYLHNIDHSLDFVNDALTNGALRKSFLSSPQTHARLSMFFRIKISVVNVESIDE